MSFLTQTELPNSAEVVIIGAGVHGCSAAFALTQLGVRDIAVIERGQLASGATGKSGALIRAHYANASETDLTIKSLDIFRNWQSRVGFGDPGFEATGFLRVVLPEDEPHLRQNVAMQRSLGGNTWVVDQSEMREIEPLLRTDDLTFAAFEPDSGYADPVATTYGFAEAAANAGARFWSNTEVLAITLDKSGVSGVITKNGTISTRSVILTAGAYADRLLIKLGIDLGLRSIRSQVVLFRWPSSMDQRRRHRVVIDSTQGSWIRPEGFNSTLIGCETGLNKEAHPDTFNEGVDAGYVDHARQALAARMPVFEQAMMRGAWSGVYMMSPDAHPIIDEIPSVPRLFVMTGDSGSSFKTAPAVGICLAEWVVVGEPRLADLTPFRSSRFAEGQPWVDSTGYRSQHAMLTVSR